MLVETARLWEDLGFYATNGEEVFRIHGVTGPDEYTTVVNDNLYTNVMARFNMRYAARVIESLRDWDPDAYERLCRRIGLERRARSSGGSGPPTRCTCPTTTELGIHPQDDSFLELEPWDFANTPADRYPLLLWFHPLVIYRHQVLKQADVVLAMVLRSDQFSLEQKRRNFDYYDPITTGDSSLSACVQAMAAAQIGYDDVAVDYFREALFVDLLDTHGNANDGVHVASAGGVWGDDRVRLRRAVRLRHGPAVQPEPPVEVGQRDVPDATTRLAHARPDRRRRVHGRGPRRPPRADREQRPRAVVRVDVGESHRIPRVDPCARSVRDPVGVVLGGRVASAVRVPRRPGHVGVRDPDLARAASRIWDVRAQTPGSGRFAPRCRRPGAWAGRARTRPVPGKFAPGRPNNHLGGGDEVDLLPLDAVPGPSGRLRGALRERVGDATQPGALRPEDGGAVLQVEPRRAGARRRARLRRPRGQRAPPERLRVHGLAEPDGRRPGPAHAEQLGDPRARQHARPVLAGAARRRGVRHARLHDRRPPGGRLPRRHVDGRQPLLRRHADGDAATVLRGPRPDHEGVDPARARSPTTAASTSCAT